MPICSKIFKCECFDSPLKKCSRFCVNPAICYTHPFSPSNDSFYVNQEVVGPLRCCFINLGPTRKQMNYMGPWLEFNLARVLIRPPERNLLLLQEARDRTRMCLQGRSKACNFRTIKNSFPYMARVPS